MRRRIVISGVLVVLVVLSVFIVLKRASKKAAVAVPPQMAISDANSAACEASAREEGYCRGSVLIVQLLPSGKAALPAIRVNAENLTWDQAEGVLRDVLETRSIRTIFLTTDVSVDLQSKDQMTGLIRRAGAERICTIDSKNAPKWYPPPPCPPAGGGAVEGNPPTAAP